MRELLLSALDDLGPAADDRALCEAALEASMLQRYQQVVAQQLGDRELARAEAALQRLSGLASAHRGRVAAALHLVIARHWSGSGDAKEAQQASRAAWEAGDTYESVFAHARFLLRKKRPLEALERATEAIRIGHLNNTSRAQQLVERIYDELGWRASGPLSPPG